MIPQASHVTHDTRHSGLLVEWIEGPGCAIGRGLRFSSTVEWRVRSIRESMLSRESIGFRFAKVGRVRGNIDARSTVGGWLCWITSLVMHRVYYLASWFLSILQFASGFMWCFLQRHYRRHSLQPHSCQ